KNPRMFMGARCAVCGVHAALDLRVVTDEDDASLIAEKPDAEPMVQHEQPAFSPHYACTTCGRPHVKVGPCCGKHEFTWVPTAEDSVVLSAEAADARVTEAEIRAEVTEDARDKMEAEKAAVEDERDTLKAKMEDLERGLKEMEQEMMALEDAIAEAKEHPVIQHQPPIEALMDDEPTGLPGVFKAQHPWDDEDRFDAA
ncbi:MAG: hypothetical protein ACPGGE_02000, partial [Poseidonia sp.]